MICSIKNFRIQKFIFIDYFDEIILFFIKWKIFENENFNVLIQISWLWGSQNRNWYVNQPHIVVAADFWKFRFYYCARGCFPVRDLSGSIARLVGHLFEKFQKMGGFFGFRDICCQTIDLSFNVPALHENSTKIDTWWHASVGSTTEWWSWYCSIAR